MDFKSIQKEINERNFKPIYLLHGEEPFYIDLLTKSILKNALEEHERDFNQSIYYGKDSDVLNIISDAKSYPMMAERRLVLVKEAQDLKGIELLENYCINTNPTTVLVLAYKYKKFDSRKKLFKEIQKNGLVFESEKVKEYQLEAWINSYLKESGYGISQKATSLLVDFLGNDLQKITNELDKLFLLLQKGTTINEIHIEENIGISKDYNVFELVNAIATRDFLKSMKIINYFDHNPKSGSIIPVVSQLYTFFYRLMRIHFLPNKSPDYIVKDLKVHPFVAKELLRFTANFSPKIISVNISILHEYDLKAKGINNSSFSDGDLMKEMIFKLLN
jgi:DNA polymerase III subunit delta